jgi:hypothetical protein
MAKRSKRALVLGVLEFLRAGAVFMVFAYSMRPDFQAARRFATAALFAPQLLFPLAWLLFWFDSNYFKAFTKLLGAGKALVLAAEIASLVILVSEAAAGRYFDPAVFLGTACADILVILADIGFLIAALAADRSLPGEEKSEPSAGVPYSGPERVGEPEGEA